jgi:hypothetical protein
MGLFRTCARGVGIALGVVGEAVGVAAVGGLASVPWGLAFACTPNSSVPHSCEKEDTCI